MIFDKFKLDGKIAVVTGAARGLGQAMALGFCEAGADLVAVDLIACDDTRQKVEALGRRFGMRQIDLLKATQADLKQLADGIVNEYGHIDILLNCAGISPRTDVFEYLPQYWHDTIQVNLNVPWYLSQIVAEHMVCHGGGKIISIASMLAHNGGVFCPGYAASKHGVCGFSKAMCNELAMKGVNINTISPGYMRTKLTEPLWDNPKFGIESRIPQNRWGLPEDLQGAALLLASSAGDYINGTDIVVDGGYLSN
jgi:2-deoxy-D-gluconate 3-dehydrogenase